MIRGTYTRWTAETTDDSATLVADLLGTGYAIAADPAVNRVKFAAPNVINGLPGPVRELDPDTARMIGVRLIEAATRAEAGTTVRFREVG